MSATALSDLATAFSLNPKSPLRFKHLPWEILSTADVDERCRHARHGFDFAMLAN